MEICTTENKDCSEVDRLIQMPASLQSSFKKYRCACSRLESRAVPRTVWCFQACVNTWRNLQFDGQETGLSHSLTVSRSHIWSLFFGPCCKLAWFSNRTGTSVDDGARKSDTWLDQWQSGKLGTKSCVQSFLCAFPSPTDVPVLLLNQPIMDRSARGTNQWTSSL